MRLGTVTLTLTIPYHVLTTNMLLTPNFLIAPYNYALYKDIRYVVDLVDT